MDRLKSWRILVLLVLLCISFNYLVNAASADNENSFGASFIFGDSLVDAGNNNYLSTESKANIPPNGIDFKASGGQPTGRFTNGRTISDILGEELGVPNYAVPYLAPNSTGKAILHGVNYASGGGGILDATGRVLGNRLGMDIQIDFYNNTRQQFDKLLGPSKAKDYISRRSIFAISIGSNDFLFNYLVPVLSIVERIFVSPDAFIDDMINHLRIQLTRLYQLDARRFAVANIGPIGCIPNQKTINLLNENECNDLANKLAVQYNDRLKDLLNELHGKLPGATFVYANVYDLMMELIANYDKYGFTTASKACCGNGGKYAGLVPCGRLTTRLCTDRDKHVFWDPYHPCEAANLIFARQLLDGSKYTFPVNLKQLKNL